jgi:hypothetical protein
MSWDASMENGSKGVYIRQVLPKYPTLPIIGVLY